MYKLFNWTVRRSGGGMAISGTNARADAVKLTRIRSIAVVNGRVIALGDDKDTYILAVEKPESGKGQSDD